MIGKQKKRRWQEKKRPTGTGVLFVVAMMFLTSGLLRFGGETGQAIAREMSELATPPMEVSSADGICRDISSFPILFEDLQGREISLTQREQSLETRLETLSVAQETFDEKLAALEDAEQSLSELIVQVETASEDDINRLTQVYENMKPKDAATLFAEMDPNFSAGFLARMRPDAAAGIMAGLEPQTAYSISVILAGRNANAQFQ